MNAGASWKEEREARGLSIEDAASRLRIVGKYLQGIEEGDYSGWPARVFSIGYIRAYAKLLGKDAEPVLTEYFQSLETGTEETPSPGYSIPTWVERERERGSRRTTYAVAAVAVLVIGLALAWIGTRISSRRVPPPPPPAAAVVPPAPPASENAVATAAPAGADNASPAASAAPPASAAPAEPPPPAPQVASVGGAGPVKAPYQLFIEASEMTWLMYALDEQEPVDVMLYPGDKISIQAKKKIVLKLGNAGGVVGTLNGKPLPPFGARGQVKEIRLGE